MPAPGNAHGAPTRSRPGRRDLSGVPVEMYMRVGAVSHLGYGRLVPQRAHRRGLRH
jgi:hypothetical protein